MEDFEDALVFNDNNMVADGLYPDDEIIEEDKINETISFYSANTFTASTYTTAGYLFALDDFVMWVVTNSKSRNDK